MKIKRDLLAINIEELKSILENNLPNYIFKFDDKNCILAIKSKTNGVFITFKKEYIIVKGDFPTWISQFIFIFNYLILGIIIPIIIYYTIFYRKFKKSEKEIGNFIISHLKTE